MEWIFNGTIIGEIEQLAEAGDFSALELTNPVLDSDKVLGDMTALEKAAFSLLMLKGKELEETCGNCQHLVAEEDCDKREHVHVLKIQLEALKALGWPLIQERLKLHGGNYSLREGFKIVEICDEEAEEQQPRHRIQIIGLGFSGRSG